VRRDGPDSVNKRRYRGGTVERKRHVTLLQSWRAAGMSRLVAAATGRLTPAARRVLGGGNSMMEHLMRPSAQSCLSAAGGSRRLETGQTVTGPVIKRWKRG